MPRKLADREQKILDILQANATINSGATQNDGDGLVCFENPINHFNDTKISVEVKCTDAKSFSLKPEIWNKIDKQARRIGTMPLLVIDIQEHNYAVMDLKDFKAILDYLTDLNLGANFIDFAENSSEDDIKQ